MDLLALSPNTPCFATGTALAGVSDTVGHHQDDTHSVLGALVLFHAYTALLCYRCPTLVSLEL
jgi:hypothetical protein